MKSPESYQPKPAEVKKAEKMMTAEEKELSNERNLTLLNLEAEIEKAIQPIADKYEQKGYVKGYVGSGGKIDALRKVGRDDLVVPFIEANITELGDNLKVASKSCQGCYCERATPKLTEYLKNVETDNLQRISEKIIALVEEVKATRFRYSDYYEGTPETLQKEVQKQLVGRLGDLMKSDTSDEQKFSFAEKITALGLPDISDSVMEKILTLNVPKEKREEFALALYKKYNDAAKPKRREGSYNIPVSLFIDKRLSLLENMAKSELSITDYPEKIKELIKDTDYIDDPNVGRKWAYRSLAEIEEADSKIKALSSDKKEELGQGLKIEKAEHSSGQKIYLDGKFIKMAINAEFSEKPTNGEIVAWVEKEIIDQDRVMGTQNRDNVLVWKKGYKNPKIIFEDHAWSKERYFRVFAPEVDADGTINVEVKSGNETKKLEFKI